MYLVFDMDDNECYIFESIDEAQQKAKRLANTRDAVYLTKALETYKLKVPEVAPKLEVTRYD